MARYRATLSYDGAAYLGYQRQHDGQPTVQGEVEKVVAKIGTGACHGLRGRPD